MESEKYTWGIGIGKDGLRQEYYSPYYEKEKHKNTEPFVLHDERITTPKTLTETLKRIIDGQFK